MCLPKALSISPWRGTGGFQSGGRILVDVVASAVSQQHTSLLLDLSDQLAALHSAISLVL